MLQALGEFELGGAGDVDPPATAVAAQTVAAPTQTAEAAVLASLAASQSVAVPSQTATASWPGAMYSAATIAVPSQSATSIVFVVASSNATITVSQVARVGRLRPSHVIAARYTSNQSIGAIG